MGKNWLFVGGPDTGWRSAVFYTRWRTANWVEKLATEAEQDTELLFGIPVDAHRFNDDVHGQLCRLGLPGLL